MKTTLKHITIGAILALNLMSTLPAYAANAKTYPGSMCVRYRGAVGVNVNLNFSAIGNPSRTEELRVDCPAIKDEGNRGTRDGWFRAIDANRSANVRCSINSFFRTNSEWRGWWTPTRSTSGFGSHAQQIHFPEDLGANDVSHYYFSCVIPTTDMGTSYITSYYLLER